MRLENKGRLPAYGVSFGVVLFDERGHYEARKAEAVINATKAVKSREMILPPSGEKEVISIPKMPWASFQKEQVTVRVAGGDENSGATLPLKIRAGIAVIVQYHWGSSNTDAHTAKTFSVSAVSASKSPGDRQLVFPLEPRVRPPKGLRVLDNGIASLT